MGDGSGSRPSSKGKGRVSQNSDVLAVDLDAAEGGIATYGGSSAFSQMQLVEQQVWNILLPWGVTH
jgi:syntaxin 5